MSIHGNKGGGKGGGGAAQRAPIEHPNTLRSRSKVLFDDVISEGPIVGLVSGLQSIYFDNTALQNSDGSFNFDGVAVHERLGLPDQEPVPGVESVSREFPVGAEILQSTPIVKTISDENVDSVIVKVRIPSLVRIDGSTGDRTPTNVQHRFFVKSDGGSFVEQTPGGENISGKTITPYERSYRLDLPEGGAPWDIKVERVTADSNSDTLSNQSLFSSYSEIIESKLYWPDIAHYGIEVDVQQFGSQAPGRTYHIKGLLIQVPSNYDPETRVYTGIWDGTFKIAWTNNPAWVVYDIIVNDRYGLGQVIGSYLPDKWALYSIGQYCDELVSDGYGGTEPRFTINTQFQSREDAIKVVNSIATVFWGMSYWGAGSLVFTQDSPEQPEFNVTPANVIDGTFNYEGSGLKTRHSVAIVWWNDPDDFGRARPEIYEDPDLIDKYGYKVAEEQHVLTNSRGQAYRHAKAIIDSENNQGDTVTYKASFDHLEGRPGKVVQISDPVISGPRLGGKIKSATTTEVTVDSAVTLEENETYTLSVVLPDKTIEERDVTNAAGEVSVLTLATALSDTPIKGAVWILSGSNVQPREFRILSVLENDKNEFEVTALQHDKNKYLRIEQDIKLETPPFSVFPTGPITPPTDLELTEYVFLDGLLPRSALTFSFKASVDKRVSLYEIEMLPPGSEDQDWQDVSLTDKVSIDVKDIINGSYKLRVRAVNPVSSQRSVWVEIEKTLLALSAPISGVSGFRMSVIDGTAYLSWDQVPDLHLKHYIVKHSASLTGDWLSSVVVDDEIKTTSLPTPALPGRYLIKAVSVEGIESVNAAVISSNIAEVFNLNVVETVTEHPGFDGVKTDVAFDNVLGGLRLDTDNVLAWDDVLSVDNWFIGEGGLQGQGQYYFDGSVDLGDVYTVTLISNVMVVGTDIDENILAVDDFLSLVNVFGVDGTDYNFQLQVRFTNDDPAVAPVWSDWQLLTTSEITGRAFEFHAILMSYGQGKTPVVSGLSVNVDMKDRIIDANDVTCPIDGMSVSFEPAFKEKPSIGVTGEDMATGDYYTISNQSRTGFNIEFFDSGNNSISRTFDYLVKGYGYVSST